MRLGADAWKRRSSISLNFVPLLLPEASPSSSADRLAKSLRQTAAPRLVTKETVAGMRPGSVIVDLAAEAGGNCELTKADEVVVAHGVTIHGPTNLPATMAVHASQLYARNVTELLNEFVKKGALAIDLDDEVIKGTCVTHDGKIVNDALKAAMATVKTA